MSNWLAKPTLKKKKVLRSVSFVINTFTFYFKISKYTARLSLILLLFFRWCQLVSVSYIAVKKVQNQLDDSFTPIAINGLSSNHPDHGFFKILLPLTFLSVIDLIQFKSRVANSRIWISGCKRHALRLFLASTSPSSSSSYHSCFRNPLLRMLLWIHLKVGFTLLLLQCIYLVALRSFRSKSCSCWFEYCCDCLK